MVEIIITIWRKIFSCIKYALHEAKTKASMTNFVLNRMIRYDHITTVWNSVSLKLSPSPAETCSFWHWGEPDLNLKADWCRMALKKLQNHAMCFNKLENPKFHTGGNPYPIFILRLFWHQAVWQTNTTTPPFNVVLLVCETFTLYTVQSTTTNVDFSPSSNIENISGSDKDCLLNELVNV